MNCYILINEDFVFKVYFNYAQIMLTHVCLQCITLSQKCDKIANCHNGKDESFCRVTTETMKHSLVRPPAVVDLNRPGTYSITPLPGNASRCPDSHYLCPGSGYCLPLYSRCNGIADCPTHLDEADCEGHTCRGFYRCRGLDRTICMHVDHLCDGWPQCPQHDDELLCGVAGSCPDRCECYGTTFSAADLAREHVLPALRYAECRGSGVTVDALNTHSMLIHLGAGACGWRNLTGIQLPNLHSLDASDNLLDFVSFPQVTHLDNLKDLDLSGNPMTSVELRLPAGESIESLFYLNVSKVVYAFPDLPALSDVFPQVQFIDFSHSGLGNLHGRELFQKLEFLDLRSCAVSAFSPDFMHAMGELRQVFADNFKLCCPVVLPEGFKGTCIAPVDEISSCDNLLKYGSYRAALAVFATSALLGNVCSFVYRLWSSQKHKTGYSVFVIHLCVSDFFMGVYLLIIGLADSSFSGRYLWHDTVWKQSVACSVSGFTSLLSCEVSSFLVCLITLDRFLVIRFPFSRLRFNTTTAHLACVIAWGLGLVLASVPLLPLTSHWAFYSQTGICIPLPVTRSDFPGRHYSFSVMVVFNLLIFLSIAAGQALIYWSVRINAMQDSGTKGKDSVTAGDRARSKEATVARRLLVVVMSDFLCWFPIGVCGLLAKVGVPVPGEINTAMAVFVLPFNSALNPFIYTYTITRENSKKRKKAAVQKFITAQIKQELATPRH